MKGGYTGDIALDDISYAPGTCAVSPKIALPVKPTSKAPPTGNPTTPGMFDLPNVTGQSIFRNKIYLRCSCFS